MSDNIQTEFQYKTMDGLDLSGRIPKDSFSQQDLYILLMSWHQAKSVETWGKIRNVIMQNSKVTDRLGVELKATELPLKVLDILTNKYLEMAVNFFTSRLA